MISISYRYDIVSIVMSIKEHPPQSTSDSEHRSGEDERLHVPVLLDAVICALEPKAGESYLDLTAGYGGHARAFLDITKNYKDATLVDRDINAIKHLNEFTKCGVKVLHTDFVTAARQLIDEGKQFDIVLADLGVSSPQLDKAERGFSFTNSGPLDMRMDPGQEVSAKTIANEASSESIAHIIERYGEEPRALAKLIAKAIVSSRPLETTEDLAKAVESTKRGRWSKRHPATRTFQAFRIAVNDELKLVEEVLPLIARLLKPGGRVGIISFHSLEDRIVKTFLKQQIEAGYESEFEVLTKKPILGSIEDVNNPRARSAKFRAAVKK